MPRSIRDDSLARPDPHCPSRSGKACFVKPVDRVAVTGLKRQVNSPGEFAGGSSAVRGGDRQFIGLEEALSSVHEGDSQDTENGFVEATTGVEIPDDKPAYGRQDDREGRSKSHSSGSSTCSRAL